MNYLYEAIKPTRLYIKQCPHCGLKYFGKSTRQDVEKYSGSGKKWDNHLKYHQVKPIHMWNSDWYHDTSISRFALKFSRMNKIVSSKQWANLKEENGLDGGFDSSDARKGRIATDKIILEKHGVTNSWQIPHVIEINKNKIPWNKGKTGIYEHRQEALEKISLAASNRIHSESTKESIRSGVISYYQNKGVGFILIDGNQTEEIYCLKTWCRDKNLDYNKVYSYINRGAIKMIPRFDSPTRRWFVGKELIRK